MCMNRVKNDEDLVKTQQVITNISEMMKPEFSKSEQAMGEKNKA